MGWSERVLKSGYWQHGLFTILNEISTNWTGILAKLDGDSTVNDTDYESEHSVTTPSIGTTYDVTIKPNGVYLGDVATLCKNIRTEFNDAMDKLAADSGVNGTTVYTNLKFGSTDNVIDDSDGGVKTLGAHQDKLVDFLDNIIEKVNN